MRIIDRLQRITWFVMSRGDCGTQLFADDLLARLLDKSLAATLTEEGWQDADWLVRRQIHLVAQLLEQCAMDDVLRIESHSPVPDYISIYGYV
jgi:hypothetical protein